MDAQLEAHPGWYHTIDLPGRPPTPGFCDLRAFAQPALRGVPLSGARCLDVGTFDGFWAFSMEERGAAQVTCLDLEDGTQADWPPNARAANEADSAASGVPWGEGFRLAAAARGSKARRVTGDVRALEPAMVDGTYDVVLCGTLLQHLRDPVGALERMKACLRPGGELVLMESFSLPLTLRHPRAPVAEYRPGVPGNRFTWWLPNFAALHDWARTAGLRRVRARPALHRPIRGAGRGDRLVAERWRAA